MNRREAIAALTSLPEVARIQVARPAEDDVIVVECDSMLSQSGHEKLRTTVQQIWPGRKVLVCQPSVRIKLVQG